MWNRGEPISENVHNINGNVTKEDLMRQVFFRKL